MICDFPPAGVPGSASPVATPVVNLVHALVDEGVGVEVITFTRDRLRPRITPVRPGLTLRALYVPPLSGAQTGFLWRRHLLIRELEGLELDIVHGQGSEIGNAWMATSVGLPSVVTLHGILGHIREVGKAPWWSGQAIAARLEVVGQRRADAVLALSENAADYAAACGARQIALIPNAVADEFFAQKPRVDLRDPARVLFLGRIEPAKGTLDYVRAVKEAADALMMSVRATVVGRPTSRDGFAYMRECQQEMAGMDRVEWVTKEWVGPADVPKLLADADILVLPSYVENLPMVVCEAIASAVPCVGYDVGGMTDLLGSGQGKVVPRGDAVRLAAAITEALESRSGYVAMSERCVGYGEVLRPRSVAMRTIEAYERVMRGKQRDSDAGWS